MKKWKVLSSVFLCSIFFTSGGVVAQADTNPITSNATTTSTTDSTTTTVEETSVPSVSNTTSSEPAEPTELTSSSSNIATTESTESTETTSTTKEEPVQPEVTLTQQAHVQNIGWMSEVIGDSATIGTTGKGLRLEAFKLSLRSSMSGRIEYRVHVSNIGWQSKVSNGMIAGTTGRSLTIEALQINLTGDLANFYDVYYRVHVQNIGWLGWTKNGGYAGTQGLSLRAEALEVSLVSKADSGFAVSNDSFIDNPVVNYQSHLSRIGWTRENRDGEITGTTGQSRPIEALKFHIANTPFGSIKYRAHVSNIGWLSWKDSNQIAGTTGLSLPMEAIQIELTGQLENKYDIYYRAHISNIGWLDWAKNGETAGSTGLSIPMEALEVKLVKKDSRAPGYTEKHYLDPAVLKKSYIIDISSYQNPNFINYDLLAQNISGAIVRIHHGSSIIDSVYERHITELQKRDVPVAVYGWALGKSDAEMRKDAEILYKLAHKFHPTFWWIDVEEKSMNNMRHGVEVFRQRLKELGAQKVGVYIANHKYKEFNIDTSKFDGVWIPTYGRNNGLYEGVNPTSTNNYDLHQYTSKGRLPGYGGDMDMSRIVRRGYSYFFD